MTPFFRRVYAYAIRSLKCNLNLNIKNTNWNYFENLKIENKITIISWKLTFVRKMEILMENGNFDRKWKFWSTMEILIENGNFDRKWKFCSKMEILFENGNFGQTLKHWSKFWTKIESLVKNTNVEKQWKMLSPKNLFSSYVRCLVRLRRPLTIMFTFRLQIWFWKLTKKWFCKFKHCFVISFVRMVQSRFFWRSYHFFITVY